MSVLVIAEHDNAALAAATLNTIAAARELDDDVHVLVAGAGCAGVADAAAKAGGVSKVRVADDAAYANQLAENLATLIASIASEYSHVLIAATKAGKNVLPRAAALLDVSLISDISGIESADTFVRPIYAGNAIATVQSTDPIKLVSVRATSFDAVAGRRRRRRRGDRRGHRRQRPVGVRRPGSDSVRTPGAHIRPHRDLRRRGMQSGDNFALLEDVADKLGAAVGASRAAVDAGFVPNDYQVGQTGKVVAPDLYVAVGISGAIQHLAGMKESKVIVAINKDEEAPIFQVADYGLVADLFQAVPELSAELSKS